MSHHDRIAPQSTHIYLSFHPSIHPSIPQIPNQTLCCCTPASDHTRPNLEVVQALRRSTQRLVRRKHHCRKCGRCICAACSPMEGCLVCWIQVMKNSPSGSCDVPQGCLWVDPPFWGGMPCWSCLVLAPGLIQGWRPLPAMGHPEACRHCKASPSAGVTGDPCDMLIKPWVCPT